MSAVKIGGGVRPPATQNGGLRPPATQNGGVRPPATQNPTDVSLGEYLTTRNCVHYNLGIMIKAFHEGNLKSRGRLAGKATNPSIDIDFGNGEVVVATSVCAPNGAARTMLTDESDYIGLADTTWYVQSSGYAYGRHEDGVCRTIHGVIMGPLDDGLSVDHVDREKLDNRRCNLRAATQSVQNANRCSRSDQLPPHPELQRIGIKQYPRYLAWDDPEKKFVFHTHPLVRSGVNASGTKSASVSMVDKFRDAVGKLIALYEAHGDDDADMATERVSLARRFNEAVRIAHDYDPAHFADGPYIDLDPLRSELQFCRDVYVSLPPPIAGAVLHGTLNQDVRIIELPALKAVAQIKGFVDNDTGVQSTRYTVYDVGFRHQIEGLPKFDVSGSNPTIPITTDLGRRLEGQQHLLAHARARKIALKDYVWIVLMGRTIPEGHVIAPFNYQQYDVRAENLVMLPGEGKNYKSPVRLECPPGCEGMRFMPRGMSVSLPKAAGGTAIVGFNNASPASECRKIATGPKCGTLVDAIIKGLAIMRSKDADFDAKNAMYQRLLGDYVGLSDPRI